MVKIEVGFIDSSMLGIKITSPLMKTYFKNFHGMLENENGKPVGISVTKKSIDCAEIKLPLTGFNSKSVSDTIMEEQNNTVGPDQLNEVFNDSTKKNITFILDLTQRFIMAAIKSISKKTEFCPILDFSGGYSFSELKKDVISAKEAKRDFLLVDSYQSYLNGMKEQTYKFNEYRIPYGTSEYCDFLLLVVNSKLDEIRKEYKDKLKPTNWF